MLLIRPDPSPPSLFRMIINYLDLIVWHGFILIFAGVYSLFRIVLYYCVLITLARYLNAPPASFKDHLLKVSIFIC